MQLARFNRIKLAHLPTPLERLDSLTRLLGGPEIWIKRDDCTGLASGGNKTRKLEFLAADAIARGADTLVTQGATQSNHVRQTAAAACKLGLKSYALLEQRVTNLGTGYETSGNVLFDDILNCNYQFRPAGTDMNGQALELTAQLKQDGHKPYFIPGGGSNPIGALGYANAAAEIVTQADELGLKIDRIIHATGSAGTQAGLLAGLFSINAPIQVTGISVRACSNDQVDKVHQLAEQTIELIGARGLLPREQVQVHDDYVGAGYGQPTEEMISAITVLAAHEGIFLDPVYSGKGLAGMIDLIDRGVIGAEEKVVFLHTGGSIGLFAYESLFSKRAGDTPIE
ncbi:MAG: D-cysteine desulfhydrase [Burkholderiaceae bacterium]